MCNFALRILVCKSFAMGITRKRYHIDALNKSNFGVTHYDACSKPHSDAEKTAGRLGFETECLYGSRLTKLGKPLWKKVLLHAYNLCWQAYVLLQSRKLERIKNADIFVQYGFSTEAMFRVVKNLNRDGNRIIMLMHDLGILQVGAKKNHEEEQLLQNVDTVIVHSQPMADKLRGLGFKGKTVILEFFDYLNDYEADCASTDMTGNIDVVFAGNLGKSTFLSKLNELTPHEGLRFFLYGKDTGNLITNDNIQYKGFFSNDDIAGIEGTWGLVWDGDSLDGCTGRMGEYLRYNAPFKLSLYLAKGLPVIVWSESAMAKYVEEYKLGITVRSLNDIYDAVRSLSAGQLNDIKEGVAEYSRKVKHGKQLEQALQKALTD